MTYRAPNYAGQAQRLHAQRLHAQPVLLPVPVPLTPPDNPRVIRGYVHKLGMTLQHQSPGRVRLHMPCTAMHVDERGQMHAGALASITDLAGTTAAWSLVPRRPGGRGASRGMQVGGDGDTRDGVGA